MNARAPRISVEILELIFFFHVVFGRCLSILIFGRLGIFLQRNLRLVFGGFLRRSMRCIGLLRGALFGTFPGILLRHGESFERRLILQRIFVFGERVIV